MRQPWAWAIVHGGKDVENRPASLGPYRGPVIITASAPKSGDLAYVEGALASPHADWEASRDLHNQWAGQLHQGVALGVVDLVSVHHDSDHGRGELHRCSPWAMPDQWHLVLANPRPLVQPIPVKGSLSLWKPEAELRAAIREQVPA